MQKKPQQLFQNLEAIKKIKINEKAVELSNNPLLSKVCHLEIIYAVLSNKGSRMEEKNKHHVTNIFLVV